MNLNITNSHYNTQERLDRKKLNLLNNMEKALEETKSGRGPSPLSTYMADPTDGGFSLSKTAQQTYDERNKFDILSSKIKDKKDFINKISEEMSAMNPKEGIREFEKLEKSKFYEVQKKKKGTETKATISNMKRDYRKKKKQLNKEARKMEPTTSRIKLENSPEFQEVKKKERGKQKAKEAKKKNYPKEKEKVKVKTSSDEKIAKGLKIGGYSALGVIALATILDVKHSSEDRQEVVKETKRQEKKLKEKEAQEKRDNGQAFGSKLQGHIINAPTEMGQMVIDMYNERIGHYKMGAAKNEIVGGAPRLNY